MLSQSHIYLTRLHNIIYSKDIIITVFATITTIFVVTTTTANGIGTTKYQRHLSVPTELSYLNMAQHTPKLETTEETKFKGSTGISKTLFGKYNVMAPEKYVKDMKAKEEEYIFSLL